MKSAQLSALKSAERFVIGAMDVTDPIEKSAFVRQYGLETKQIIQRAIVDAELQPDLRVEMPVLR